MPARSPVQPTFSDDSDQQENRQKLQSTLLGCQRRRCEDARQPPRPLISASGTSSSHSVSAGSWNSVAANARSKDTAPAAAPRSLLPSADHKVGALSRKLPRQHRLSSIVITRPPNLET
ncbi:MAG: hypothetical protein U0528_07690 [Anaerolineae bacterium]